MGETINAGIAMMKVLEDWDVQQVYGIPGGSINSTMMRYESKRIRLLIFRFVMKKLVRSLPQPMQN